MRAPDHVGDVLPGQVRHLVELALGHAEPERLGRLPIEGLQRYGLERLAQAEEAALGDRDVSDTAPIYVDHQLLDLANLAAALGHDLGAAKFARHVEGRRSKRGHDATAHEKEAVGALLLLSAGFGLLLALPAGLLLRLLLALLAAIGA